MQITFAGLTRCQRLRGDGLIISLVENEYIKDCSGNAEFPVFRSIIVSPIRLQALIGGLYGVTFTRIGYSGGVKLHPTYRRIGDHTEVVEVHYNTKLITLSDILEVFFENHDYSAVFPSRYMSSVFYTDERQKDETEYFIKHNLVRRWHKSQVQEGDVATVVKPLTSYHDAEHIYHKYYLQNVPTLMLQLLYEYQWDWKTWFKEFNVLPFVTK